MVKTTLNKNGLATKAGEITVYNYHAETRELLSSSVEYLVIGLGIPANSCNDAPGDTKDGFAICRTADGTGWEYIEDHRGATVYDTETGQPIEITTLGDYPDNVTTVAPATPYDKWDGGEWVIDKDAQKVAQVLDAEQKKSSLLTLAKNTISLWQTELQLGIIREEDKASLIAWMKYIQALQDVDTELAPDIEWPQQPE